VHRFLAEAPTDERVTRFVVDSRDRRQALTGLSVSATGFARTRVACIVAGERWANEGLATTSGGRVRDDALHDLAKHLLEQGSLPALATMIERFPGLPARLSYPAAGSFVLSLRDVHGLDAIRRVRQQGSRALPGAERGAST